MGFGGVSHWIIILVIVVLLFGVGRISGVMGELGKGLKSFKKGLAEDEEQKPGEKRQLPPQGQAPERPIDVTPEPARQSPPSDDQPRG